MRRNLNESVKVVYALGAEARSGAGAVLSPAIDTAGFTDCLVLLNAGGNAAGGTNDVIVQECATSGGAYSAITGAAFTQITTANDNQEYIGRIDLSGTERFIQISATDAVAACASSVTVLMSAANSDPITNETGSGALAATTEEFSV